MGLRNFRLQIVSRIIILFALLLGLAAMVTSTQWRVTPFVFGALALVSVVNLIHYIEFTNRTFSEFLNSIYFQDFSTKVPVTSTGTSFKQLSSAYKLITDSFRRITYQKEEHLSLLEAIVDHLQIAVMCVDDKDRIKLLNKAAKQLFHTPHIHRVDALERIDPFIYACVKKMLSGEQQLVHAKIKGLPVSLSVLVNEFRVGDTQFRLFSFHNIRDQLEQKESDAWQKLIRVLAHEIMNSATPILSLSSSIKSMLQSEDDSQHIPTLTDEEQLDVKRGLDSIESRSKGLIQFVEAYRGLTHIPEPKPEPIDVPLLVQNVCQLLLPDISAVGISLDTRFEGQVLTAMIDPQQIEQVLINLMRNAIQALDKQKNPRIKVVVEKSPQGKIVIDVEDNGCGIESDNLANIFMPFYTTKAEGTGVGLSISRQMMFMNRGLLTVDSKAGEGSRFRMEFGG